MISTPLGDDGEPSIRARDSLLGSSVVYVV